MNEQRNFAEDQRLMEANAEAAIAQSIARDEDAKSIEEQARIAAEVAQVASSAKQDKIKARLLGPEIRKLNDAAELAIYGSHGRTEGYVDPSRPDPTTGKPMPITKPVKGTLDMIRENPRYGTKKADREVAGAQAADKYQRDVEDLVEGKDGLQLTQAKLIMDKREAWQATNEAHDKEQRVQGRKHAAEIDRRVSLIEDQYVQNGVDPKEAHGRALLRVSAMKAKSSSATVKRIDTTAEEAKLKALIKSEGIFTADEYDEFIIDMAARRASTEHSSDNDHGSPEKPDAGKDRKRKPSSQEKPWKNVKGDFVQMGGANEKGLAIIGVEFSRKGDVLRWEDAESFPVKGLNREIVMEGKDGSAVVIQGNNVSYWEQKDGKLVLVNETELAETSHLPNAEIDGKTWRLKGRAEDGSSDIVLEQVKAATVKIGLTDPRYVYADSKYANMPLYKRSEDTFKELKTMLRYEHFKQKLETEVAAQRAKEAEDKEGLIRRAVWRADVGDSSMNLDIVGDPIDFEGELWYVAKGTQTRYPARQLEFVDVDDKDKEDDDFV